MKNIFYIAKNYLYYSIIIEYINLKYFNYLAFIF
ncbi:hypothetical protein SAMN05216431_11255 [Ligilactobacillus sp. WC1T17]|uniref:Uncharacterized protein n=1 Tax=Ligilactobacillus ruminis TaxID=1623 RepID=A0ABY1AD36_9LACO|nr:hypothetical protein SAMN05216431_11255 [Ligilactobacillus ruminis]